METAARDPRRVTLGELVVKARERRFASVTAALQASGVNRATWLRIENGDKVRDDRLLAAEKALDWPPGIALDYLRGKTAEIYLNDDGTVASEILANTAPGPSPNKGVNLAELTARIEDLARRLEQLERRGDDNSGRSADGGSVTPIRPPSTPPPIPEDVAAHDPGVPSQGDRARGEQDAGYDVDQDPPEA